VYILHDFLPSGNGYKCRLLLRFLKQPFKLIEHDILEGETRTDQFITEKNPNGRIPVLELEDGTTLSESGAILYFLGHGTPFLPDDHRIRSEILRWMFFEQYSLEPNVAVRRFWLTEQKDPLSDEQQIRMAGKLQKGNDALRVLEIGLNSGPWLVTESATIADIMLYGYTHAAHEGGFDLSPYPNIRAWIKRFQGIPGHVPITDGSGLG